MALIKYARWLRSEYEFPMRVPVYLSPRIILRTIHSEEATASFFAPFHRKVEPYIRIATGDYVQLKKEKGRDNALASYIVSLSHEVIHYQQWIETGDCWEKGVARKAVSMLRRYEKTTDQP
jgi:hypothetical protein